MPPKKSTPKGSTKTAAQTVQAKRSRSSSPKEKKDSSDVDCCVCLELLTNAHQTPCCGTLMCLECLNQVAKESKHCPLCRKPLKDGHPDVRAERAAANTVGVCPFKGCDHSAKRDELKKHVTSCPKRPVESVLSDCRAEIAVLKAKLKLAHRQTDKLRQSLVDQCFSRCLDPRSLHPLSAIWLGTSTRDLLYCHTAAVDGEGIFPFVFRVRSPSGGTDYRHVEIDSRAMSFGFFWQGPSEEPPGTWTYVLLHPTDVYKSHPIEVTYARQQNAKLIHEMNLPADGFADFVKHGKIVLAEVTEWSLARREG